MRHTTDINLEKKLVIITLLSESGDILHTSSFPVDSFNAPEDIAQKVREVAATYEVNQLEKTEKEIKESTKLDRLMSAKVMTPVDIDMNALETTLLTILKKRIQRRVAEDGKTLEEVVASYQDLVDLAGVHADLSKINFAV